MKKYYNVPATEIVALVSCKIMETAAESFAEINNAPIDAGHMDGV
jgi:hypothetical protein